MKQNSKSSVYWAQINFIMGGTLGFTQIRNGKRESQHRWTNVFPDFINSYRFHFPDSPEAMEKYITDWEEPYRGMQEDWEKNGPDGPFEHNMTDCYFGPEVPRFSPCGYGLLVLDFDKKIGYHCQGYSNFGVLEPMISLTYSSLVHAMERGESSIRARQRDIDEFEQDIRPLFDQDKLQLYYMTNIDENGQEKEKGIWDKVESRLKLDFLNDMMTPLPLDQIKIGDNFSVFMDKPSEVFQRDWCQRNLDKLPEDFKAAMNLMKDQKGWYDSVYMAFHLGIKSDWKFIRYDESREGFLEMMKDMDAEYGLSQQDKEAWNEYISGGWPEEQEEQKEVKETSE